ncbi:uroporphyrinogen-III C-methyltransferase [Neptunicella sp. SCSIO 80796]|uniref:uroporphyrinogen-III C-methyltransferase n=1 Tax=Neptunicella plasticusilytica TaxID=3117012 RepID=UPI003A4DC6EA
MSEFLLFRPQPKCELSCQKMRDAGLTVHGLPLQAISADENEIKRFTEQFTALPAKSCVVFTSTYAAEFAVKAMNNTAWPAQYSYFAVGKSTASILQQAGINVRLPKRFDSEGLLEMAELIDVANKTVVIVKGHHGRMELDKELTERKAEVQVYNLYQRTSMELEKARQTWQKPAIQCIIATSGEQVELAFEQFDSEWLCSLTWITVSQRIVDILAGKDVSKVILSTDATDDALITSAKQFLEQQAMTESQGRDKLNKLEKEIKQEQQSAVKQTVAKSAPTADSVSANKAAATPPERKQISATGGWFKLLTLVNFLILLAMAAGAYWFWQQWTANQQIQQQQLDSQLQTQQHRLSSQQQALTESLQDFQKRLENAQNQEVDQFASQVDRLTQQVKTNQQHLLDMSGRRPSDWLIAEADYLVRMAGRKLWLEHDVATAVLMLQSADARLAGMNDPSLLPVREKIADDIQTLNLINPVSLPELALQLTAMLKQVNNLPLAMIQLPESDTAENSQSLSDSVGDWQTNLAKSWHALVDDFITVRRRIDNVQPLLNEQQQWLVREQLKHYLQQVQLAVLREQTELFAPLLQLAQQNIQQYFELKDNRVSQFKQQLEQLANTDISRHYPQQLQSTRPLQDLLQQRVSRVYDNSAQSQIQPVQKSSPAINDEDPTL